MIKFFSSLCLLQGLEFDEQRTGTRILAYVSDIDNGKYEFQRRRRHGLAIPGRFEQHGNNLYFYPLKKKITIILSLIKTRAHSIIIKFRVSILTRTLDKYPARQIRAEKIIFFFQRSNQLPTTSLGLINSSESRRIKKKREHQISNCRPELYYENDQDV